MKKKEVITTVAITGATAIVGYLAIDVIEWLNAKKRGQKKESGIFQYNPAPQTGAEKSDLEAFSTNMEVKGCTAQSAGIAGGTMYVCPDGSIHYPPGEDPTYSDPRRTEW